VTTKLTSLKCVSLASLLPTRAALLQALYIQTTQEKKNKQVIYSAQTDVIPNTV